MTDRSPELPVHAYVVLGMLSLGPRSGYEIKRDVDHSIRFFWTISQAQVYPSLELLERHGLITGRDEPSGRRLRRIHELTAAGRAALHTWLVDPGPIPFELRDVGLLKLFFAAAVEPPEATDLLHAVRRRSEERVATLAAIRPEADELREQGNPHPVLTLEMGIAVHQAMADTCAGFAASQPESSTHGAPSPPPGF